MTEALLRCYEKLEQHTYDAMWCNAHGRVEVPHIHPDGSHTITHVNLTYLKEHFKMTTPSDIPNIFQGTPNLDEARERLQDATQDIRDKAQEALSNPLPPQVQQAKNFVQANQALIITAATVLVLAKLNKRMIRKVVRKELLVGLATTPVLIDIPAYMKDVDAFYAAEQAARTAAAWAHTTPAG